MVRTKSQVSRDLENPRGPPEFQLLQETEMLEPILVVRSMLEDTFLSSSSAPQSSKTKIQTKKERPGS